MTGSPGPRIWSVGTLGYTQAGLVVLFGWLLWGDFIFSLMEGVMPSLLPLSLKNHGASNREIAIIVSTLYMAVNTVMNPIISYKSDRFRSRWGRRRPFIVVTTPLVVLFLCAIPFAPEILAFLMKANWMSALFALSPSAPVITMIAVLVVGFQMFNMFISSVYYYLIPDVVPQELLGRFMGLFRIFGTAAGMVYNYFIFGHASTHMREIFVGIAIIYGCFILLMCWRVKEGDYPPPIQESHGHWWSGIRNYAKECFGYSYYWQVFLTYSCLVWSGCAGVFVVFFLRDEIGLSLPQIGTINASAALALMVALIPFGWLLDKWGAHRMLIAGFLLQVISSLVILVFVQGYRSALLCSIFGVIPIAMTGLAAFKWTVDVYPRARFGQFGSAGALFSSLGAMVLGPLCGTLIDALHVYRYLYVWYAIFALIGALSAMVVFQRWKALGGPDNYQAP
jgi:maltose/moltooligosaccharide transporter